MAHRGPRAIILLPEESKRQRRKSHSEVSRGAMTPIYNFSQKYWKLSHGLHGLTRIKMGFVDHHYPWLKI
jgi:hypothetical protein